MTSSDFSLPSLQDSTSGENGPPPKKRARGRPLKAAGQSNIPEERRKQVRKAQEAFRQRKQAAVRSLEQRAEALEDCVEQISKVFLNFSDSMLRTQVVQKHPEIGRSLLSTTSRIVDLARIADSTDHNSFPVDYEEIEMSSGSDSKVDDFNTTRTPKSPPRRPCSSVLNFVPRRMSSTSNSINIFGNGWFRYEPTILPQLAAQENQNIDTPICGFGLKLINTNLHVAYFALLDEEVSTRNSIALQMFRYAFLYHTRDEILASLRWFLEHGMAAQQFLARAVFGFDTTLSLQHLNVVHRDVKAKVLHPLVDAQALLEADYTHPISPFLNAFDIEEYLVREGAFHIDDEVIHLKISSSEEVRGSESISDMNAHDASHSPTTKNRSNVCTDLLGPSDTPQWMAESTCASHTTNTEISFTDSVDQGKKTRGKPCELFNFNALLEDENNQSIMPDIQNQESGDAFVQGSKIITLNVPILLDNLSRNSVCLGTGPGYHRSSVEIAIQSSMQPSQAPY